MVVLPVIGLFASLVQGDPIDSGRVETRAIYSRALGVTKAITVYLPPSYATSGRSYPVVYYLHGALGNERSWVDGLELHRVADSLFRGGLPEAILVMPDGDTGYWTDWATPEGFSELCRRDTVRREPAATYCVIHGRYETYVTEDLVPLIDREYRTIADREHRALAGLSMGGYGAFWLALKHPELWGAAVSHSGVVNPLYVGPHPFVGNARFAAEPGEILEQWAPRRRPLFLREFGTDTSGWWARDPFRQLLRLVQAGQQLPHLFFDVGTADFLADQNRALADTLRKLAVPHRFAEWPGGHDAAYWRAHEAEGLGWLLRLFPSRQE